VTWMFQATHFAAPHGAAFIAASKVTTGGDNADSLRRSTWSGLHCGVTLPYEGSPDTLRRSTWSGLHCGERNPTIC
jgi:hypothetical protein